MEASLSLWFVNSAKKLQKHAGGSTGPDSTIISEFINVFGSS